MPDWFTRRVLSWRVSITLEADCCVEAGADALARHGQPDIFYTDHGSQFTCTDFINVLSGREIKISIDGQAAWRDTVLVEHLWRTITSEEVGQRVRGQRIRGQRVRGQRLDRAHPRLLQQPPPTSIA